MYTVTYCLLTSCIARLANERWQKGDTKNKVYEPLDIEEHCQTSTVNTGDAEPIRQPVRRISPQQREEVRALLSEMLANGVIERSTSP